MGNFCTFSTFLFIRETMNISCEHVAFTSECEHILSSLMKAWGPLKCHIINADFNMLLKDVTTGNSTRRFSNFDMVDNTAVFYGKGPDSVDALSDQPKASV